MPVHDIEHLALYGYCSLRYRYRVEWGLPYRELSPESAYAVAAKQAVSHLLFALGKYKSHRAQEMALALFDRRWTLACKDMDWDPMKMTGLRLEGHLALRDFFQRIGTDDRVIGGKLETDLAVDEDLVLRGRVDGLIMKGDQDKYRTLCIVHITDERTPLASPRFQPLRQQWALKVVRRQLQYFQGKVAHWVFSPFTYQHPKLYDAPNQQVEFVETARALAHGVNSKVFFQTPHQDRCQSCWYRKLCSARHCGKVPQKEIDEILSRP